MVRPTDAQVEERWDNAPDTIREALFSPFYNEILDRAAEAFHISDAKADILRRIMFMIFLGFVDIQDLYKEIKDGLAIDPRVALEIYHEVEKNVLDPFRKDIDAFRLKYKLGVIKEGEVPSPKSVPERVVLKEGPEVINLKTESRAEVSPAPGSAPIKLSVTASEKPATAPSAQPKPFAPGPVPLGTAPLQQRPVSIPSQMPKEMPPITAEAQQKPFASPQPAAAQGPIIIHKKEESQSIAQSQASAGYKQTSFGGIFGSFKTLGVNERPKDTISSAQIQMPSDQRPKDVGADGKVPVVVKKYEEPVKTIHYSDLRTPITPKSEAQTIPTPQTSKQGAGGGMIDLGNLTIKQ